LLALVNDHNFDVLCGAHREHQLGAEAQEPILVRDDEPLHLLTQNHFEKPV